MTEPTQPLDLDKLIQAFSIGLLMGTPDVKRMFKEDIEFYTNSKIAESRIDELCKAFKVEGGHLGKISPYPASIRFQEYYDKRLAQLKDSN